MPSESSVELDVVPSPTLDRRHDSHRTRNVVLGAGALATATAGTFLVGQYVSNQNNTPSSTPESARPGEVLKTPMPSQAESFPLPSGAVASFPPEASPSGIPTPEVKDLKTTIEEEYGIRIIDATSGDFNKDLENLRPILKAVPVELFSQKADGGKINVAITNPEGLAKIQGQLPEGAIGVSETSLTTINKEFNGEINQAYLELIDNLALAKDDLGGNVTSNKIWDLLGGENFKINPYSFLPGLENPPALHGLGQKVKDIFIDEKGTVRTKKEIFEGLVDAYISGQGSLIEIVTDPEIDRNAVPYPNNISVGGEIGRNLYSFFGNKLVIGVENGIPVLSDRPLPQPTKPPETSTS